MNVIKLPIILLFMLLASCGSNTQPITQNASWSTPVKIDGNNVQTSTRPAINNNGEILVGFSSAGEVYVDIYSPITGSTAIHKLGTGCLIYKLAMNDSKEAVVIYAEINAGSYDYKAITYSPETGWQPPHTIRSVLSSQGQLFTKAAIDSTGAILVVWDDPDVTNGSHAYWVYFSKNSGWSTPQKLSNNASGYTKTAGVAVNSNSIFLVLWEENQSGSATGYKGLFNPMVGWNMPEPYLTINTSNNYGSINPYRMSNMDDYGDVAIFFNTYDGSSVINRPGKLGMNSSLIFPNFQLSGTIWMPDITSSSNGNTFVVWDSWNNTSHNIEGADFTNATGWGNAKTITNNGFIGPFTTGCSGVDNYGNKFLAYTTRDNDLMHLNILKFTPDSGWGSPTMLGDTSQDVFNYSLQVNSAGNAAIIWTSFSGTLPQASTFISFYGVR